MEQSTANAHEQMRRFWRDTPVPDDDGPVFDGGQAAPSRDNPYMAMAIFEAAVPVHEQDDGWPSVDAQQAAAVLATGTLGKGYNSVVPIHGTTTPTRAFVFPDGSTVIGTQVGARIRLYPGFLLLRHRLRGARLSVRVGQPDGSTSHTGYLRLDTTPDTPPHTPSGRRPPSIAHHPLATHRTPEVHALTGAQLAGKEPHPHLDAHRWVGRLRAAVDRCAPVFARLQGLPHPPTPGMPWDGHAYPRFLPHPSLTEARIAERTAILTDAALWIHACLSRSQDPLHRVEVQMEGGTLHAVVHKQIPASMAFGFSKATRKAYIPQRAWIGLFPAPMIAAMATLCHEDAGLRYTPDNNRWKPRPWDLPYVGIKGDGGLSAHQRLAYAARWGTPSQQAALGMDLQFT